MGAGLSQSESGCEHGGQRKGNSLCEWCSGNTARSLNHIEKHDIGAEVSLNVSQIGNLGSTWHKAQKFEVSKSRDPDSMTKVYQF